MISFDQDGGMSMYFEHASVSTKRWTVLLAFLLLMGCGGSIISDAANTLFYENLEPFSITIYPLHVVRGQSIDHDPILAERLAGWLQEQSQALPFVAKDTISVPIEWGVNQARMLRRSAETFSARISESAIETEYALLVEILSNPDESWVGGVHFYLVDQTGRIASAGLSNSHHQVFKDVEPQDREGGYRVLTGMLEASWGSKLVSVNAD
ncbi:hypothetical protein ACFL4K_00650 [Candidatus Neomarinimicrobiota bacterium]